MLNDKECANKQSSLQSKYLQIERDRLLFLNSPPCKTPPPHWECTEEDPPIPLSPHLKFDIDGGVEYLLLGDGKHVYIGGLMGKDGKRLGVYLSESAVCDDAVKDNRIPPIIVNSFE